MTKSFLTKKIFSIFAIFTFVLVSTTTLAHAGVIQNIKYFLFGEPTVPTVVTTPITNPSTSSGQAPTTVQTLPSTSGISENDLYLALTKISRLPDNIISQLRGPQGPKGDIGPKGSSGLSTYSNTGNSTNTPPVTNVYNTYTSSGGGGSGSSTLWRKKNDDIYYNKGNIAIGASSFSGDSALEVTGGSDTLGDEQIIHGNFDDDVSDELVTDNTFSGTGWVDNGGGSFTHTAGQTASLTKEIGGLEGHFYRVSVDLSGGTDGELCWGVGSDMFDGVGWDATGTVSLAGIASGSEVFFDPTCGGDDMTGAYDGEISNISVEDIYWNYDPGEWTISDNKATHVSGTGSLYQNGNLTPGVVYKVSAKIGGTTGTVVVALDDGADGGVGTHETFDAGSGVITFFGISKNNYGIKTMFSPSADFNGTIEDVSLKPVVSSGVAQSWYDTNGNEVLNIKNSGLDSLNIGLGNFTVTADGNVGIGTAYPSTTLTVDGDITLTRDHNIFFEDYAGTAWKMNWTYDTDFTKSLATSNSLNLEVSNNPNEGFAIGRAGGNSLFELLGSDGTAYFRGNVGVGTPTPNANLQIEGSSPSLILSNTALNAGTVSLYFSHTPSSFTGSKGGVAILTQSTGAWGEGNLYFALQNSGTGVDATVADARMTILNTGFVGIGNTTPSVALDVTGDIEYTGTITDVSDRRLKDNIQDYTGALDIISNLQAKSYNMISTPDKSEVGFIAQDVKSIFPNATSIIDPEKGYLGVSYVSLVPVIAQAVKELNLKVENLAVVPTDGSENGFLVNLFNTLTAWFANAENHITRIFTGEICLTSAGEEPVCLNSEELKALKGSLTLPQTETPPAPDPNPAPSPDPIPDPTPEITPDTTPSDPAPETPIENPTPETNPPSGNTETPVPSI